METLLAPVTRDPSFLGDSVDANELIPRVRASVARVFEIANPDSLGLDDDLTLHGLDSMKMLELAADLGQEFGCDPLMDGGEPMIDLDSLTIRGLSDRIVEAMTVDTREKPEAISAMSNSASLPQSERIQVTGSFEVLKLGSDDRVPNSMLALLGYDYDFCANLPSSIGLGLKAFPHLAGRLTGTEQPWDLAVEPSGDGVMIEFAEALTTSLADLEELSHPYLVRHFFPSGTGDATDQLLRHPLLAVKATRLANGASVLGVLVSHALVDGKGLSLFLQHCTADIRQAIAPEPMHSREVLAQQAGAEFELPSWYTTEAAPPETEHESSLARRYGLTVFTVMDEDLSRSIGQCESNPWFQLTASLSRELHELAEFDEVAMWCDVRGRHGIPQNYTGNVGCYWHEAITKGQESHAAFAERLQSAVTGAGMSRVADVYRATKQAEASGHSIRWRGTSESVLPVNLVPFSLAPLDFGGGGPKFARILNRNLHGLRISRDPVQSGYTVEACLPGEMSEMLVEALRCKGLVANSMLMES